MGLQRETFDRYDLLYIEVQTKSHFFRWDHSRDQQVSVIPIKVKQATWHT
jgi:hypothetical protein